MTATPGSAEPTPSRAGRNLPAAIASGVVLAALVVMSLAWVPWLFGVLAAIVLVIALHELITAFAGAGIHVAQTPVYVTTVVAMAAAYIAGAEALLAVMGAGVVAVLLWRIRRGSEGYLQDVSASIFLLGYVALMAGFTMLMLAAPDGPWRIIVFILLTIGNDIGGYATGVLFGKHPIAPQISPKIQMKEPTPMRHWTTSDPASPSQDTAASWTASTPWWSTPSRHGPSLRFSWARPELARSGCTRADETLGPCLHPVS